MVDTLFPPEDARPWADDPTPNPRRSRPAGEGLDRSPRELARTDDPETSHAAAAGNRKGKSNHRIACLREHHRAANWNPPGLTDDEVSQITGMSEHETGRRCSDLRRLGLIKWLEPLEYRPTRLGRQARVSVITPAGEEALR